MNSRRIDRVTRANTRRNSSKISVHDVLLADRLRAAHEYANQKAARRRPVVAFSKTVTIYTLHDDEHVVRDCVPENFDGPVMRTLSYLFRVKMCLCQQVQGKKPDLGKGRLGAG